MKLIGTYSNNTDYVKKTTNCIMNAETSLIRSYIEKNLKLGLTHDDIIKQLGIPRTTYFRHVRRIYKEYEKVWDQCYAQSAVYYASQLVQRLEECINLCKSIRDNPNEDSKVRMEASQTMCIAESTIIQDYGSLVKFRRFTYIS